MEFSEETLEKKFSELRDSQFCISETSKYCMSHKREYKKIIQCWSKFLKKAKIPLRLSMFYLANDIIQTCKRKNYRDIMDYWAPYIKEAAYLVTSQRVRERVLRIFTVWESRSIYDERFIKDVKDIFAVRNSEEDKNKIMADFQPRALFDKIRNSIICEMESDSQYRKLESMKFDSLKVEKFHRNIKDRREGDDHVLSFEEGAQTTSAYIDSLEKELKERSELVSMLEMAQVFYEGQKGEVKVVFNAYKNYAGQVKSLKKKLDALLPTIKEISPIPSPDINAPSPSPDHELRLPSDEAAPQQQQQQEEEEVPATGDSFLNTDIQSLITQLISSGDQQGVEASLSEIVHNLAKWQENTTEDDDDVIVENDKKNEDDEESPIEIVQTEPFQPPPPPPPEKPAAEEEEAMIPGLGEATDVMAVGVGALLSSVAPSMKDEEFELSYPQSPRKERDQTPEKPFQPISPILGTKLPTHFPTWDSPPHKPVMPPETNHWNSSSSSVDHRTERKPEWNHYGGDHTRGSDYSDVGASPRSPADRYSSTYDKGDRFSSSNYPSVYQTADTDPMDFEPTNEMNDEGDDRRGDLDVDHRNLISLTLTGGDVDQRVPPPTFPQPSWSEPSQYENNPDQFKGDFDQRLIPVVQGPRPPDANTEYDDQDLQTFEDEAMSFPPEQASSFSSEQTQVDSDYRDSFRLRPPPFFPENESDVDTRVPPPYDSKENGDFFNRPPPSAEKSQNNSNLKVIVEQIDMDVSDDEQQQQFPSTPDVSFPPPSFTLPPPLPFTSDPSFQPQGNIMMPPPPPPPPLPASLDDFSCLVPPPPKPLLDTPPPWAEDNVQTPKGSLPSPQSIPPPPFPSVHLLSPRLGDNILLPGLDATVPPPQLGHPMPPPPLPPMTDHMPPLPPPPSVGGLLPPPFQLSDTMRPPPILNENLSLLPSVSDSLPPTSSSSSLPSTMEDNRISSLEQRGEKISPPHETAMASPNPRDRRPSDGKDQQQHSPQHIEVVKASKIKFSMRSGGQRLTGASAFTEDEPAETAKLPFAGSSLKEVTIVSERLSPEPKEEQPASKEDLNETTDVNMTEECDATESEKTRTSSEMSNDKNEICDPKKNDPESKEEEKKEPSPVHQNSINSKDLLTDRTSPQKTPFFKRENSYTPRPRFNSPPQEQRFPKSHEQRFPRYQEQRFPKYQDQRFSNSRFGFNPRDRGGFRGRGDGRGPMFNRGGRRPFGSPYPPRMFY